MRHRLALAAAVSGCLLLEGTLCAQQAVPAALPSDPTVPSPATYLPASFAQPLPVAPVLATPAQILPREPGGETNHCADSESICAIDLLLGQQTGVRAQVAIARWDHAAVAVEAFYGVLLHRLGSSEAAGGGGRYLFRRGAPDSTNSMTLGPGLDVFAQLNSHRLVLVNPSVEVSWLHGFGDRCGWEIGLNAGLGVGIGGRRNGDTSGVGAVTPLISGFFGFRF